MQEDLGFVIDLEGEDPASLASNSEHVSATSLRHSESLLATRAAADGAKTSRSRKKAVNRRGKPTPRPTRGRFGPRLGQRRPAWCIRQRPTADEEGLAAAAAGISITRTNDTNGITDPS